MTLQGGDGVGLGRQIAETLESDIKAQAFSQGKQRPTEAELAERFSVNRHTVRRGIAYLQNQPRQGARWAEDYWTGTGFPRVFYLKYHGYSAYFPLWALARYRNLIRSNERRVSHGM